MSGTALAQFINMAAIPLLTRLYGPESYGMMGSFMSVVNILIPLSALSYPIAIVLPKKNKTSNVIAKLSVLIGIISCILLLILLLLTSNLFNDKYPLWFLYLLPVTTIFLPIQQVGQQWLIREKRYKEIAKISIIQAIVINLNKLSIGFMFASAKVLVIITALAYVFQALQTYYRAQKFGLSCFADNSMKYVLRISKIYYDFPLYRTPQVLVNAISQSLPILILAYYFGAKEAGFFGLAQTILGAPVTLLTGALSNVLFPKITNKIQNKEKITPLLFKSFSGLFLSSLVIYSSIIIAGPTIFEIIFGKAWVISGEYGRWMSIYCIFWLTARPAIDSIPSLKIQHNFLVYEVISLALRFTGLMIGVYSYNNGLYAMIYYSIINALSYITLMFFVFKKARLKEHSW